MYFKKYNSAIKVEILEQVQLPQTCFKYSTS